MIAFEERGVEFQYNSASATQAKKNFSNSCNACCRKGIRLDCNRCAISATHSLVLAMFQRVSVSVPGRV